MEDMNIAEGGEHEELAIDYQCLEIARLNEVLKRHGIADKKLRQEICSEYIFDNSYFLDAGWFKREDKQLYPVICFAEREVNLQGNLGDIQILHVPTQDYELHDSTFGNIDWYFEEHNDDASEIETGSFQQSDSSEE